jgi:hypothetical protein
MLVTQPSKGTTLELGLVGMMIVGRSMQLQSNGNTSKRYAFTFISNIYLFLCPLPLRLCYLKFFLRHFFSFNRIQN